MCVPILSSLTLGAHAQRGLVVRVCVCLSVCLLSHLTSGASVRPANTLTYSVGNEGQKICGAFSETAPLQRSSTAPLKHTYGPPFSCGKRTRTLHSACVLKVRECMAPRVLHFSAFILLRSILRYVGKLQIKQHYNLHIVLFILHIFSH